MTSKPALSAAADSDLPVLQLRRNEDRRLRAGHSWIFSNEVDTTATPLTAFRAGQVARVMTDRAQFMGYAYVNPHALIAARLMSRDQRQPVSAGLLRQRLAAALELRESLYHTPYYRWVFGESDGLPGLILDRFNDVVVGQIATAGMQALQIEVAAAVQGVAGIKALLWKNDGGARKLEELELEISVAFGEVPETIDVYEHPRGGDALHCVAPLAAGQKTGWFFDQANNRARLPRFLKPGGRVLDVCSYVGAWGVQAAMHGAGAVTCVDASQSALDFVARNAALNKCDIQVVKGDAFDVLTNLADTGQRFDTVILDPPAFIKRKKELPQGQAAYRKLNQLALRVLDPGGVLVSCSCSYHLSQDDLQDAIQSAARHVDRFVQILEVGGQASDHPIHPAIAETRYLKALFCRVNRD